MKASLRLVALGVAVAIARPAMAHLGLRYPPSRYGDYVLKEGPCGVAGGARSANVTALEPGVSIHVVWDEYVNHPGHFRISFDADGDDDFADPKCSSGCTTRSPAIELYSNGSVLLDGIADTRLGGESGAQVTLPDVECDRCTLQVIQVMYDKPPYVTPGNDIYYQCADLVLRRSVASATPTTSPTPSPTAVPPTPSYSPAPSPSPVPPTTASSPTLSPSPTPPLPTATCGDGGMAACTVRCVGDCDGSGKVAVNELVMMVAIALGSADVSNCVPGDADGDGAIRVDELVGAVQHSLSGCSPS